MDLKALIAKMDKIESKQILNEAITMKDIQAAVGQEKDEQKRAGILNDLAWKENLPGLYDPVSGYFIRKQSPNPENNQVSIAATAREADTQALAKLGLVPGTAKTSALGGLIGTGKFGLDKDSQAANDKASSAVKQQSANVQGKQSSDAFIAPKLKRLNDLVAKISGSTMESISFNGSISRTLVESFSYELYEKVTLGTGEPVRNPATGVTAGKYQSEVAEIKSLMAELADIDDPAVIQALGAAQKAVDKLAAPTGQKVDPNQADRDDAEMGKAMRANAQAAREKEYGDNTDRADAEQGAAMRANAQAAREKEYGDNVDRTDAELGKAMAANAAGSTTKPSGQSASPAAGKVGAGKVGPANPGTKAIQHYLNTKHGQKLDLDGKDGPLTTAAIRSLSGKISTDEYANIAGLAYAYNVKPGQGPGTVSLGNPEFVKRMTALGYDPKTGNPVGGAKPSTGAGQSVSPAGTAGPRVNTTNTTELENSIKAIEAILAKNKIKSESIHPDDALVLENISNFTLQEQMEIWSLLVEAGPRTAAQQASMQTAATGINPPNNPFGLTPNRAAPTTSKTGKLAKFASKLGGFSGIRNKIAARAGASALAGPAALIVGAGMAAWTAYDVGKALYDTFKDDELPSMDPADQEAIKKHMAVILQYQKNTDMMAQLPPELKTRLEGALKGLDKIAAGADTDTDTATSVGASVGSAAAKAKQVAGSAVDSTVDAGNKFAAGVKQGYNQQAASPSASQSTNTSTQSNQSVSGTMRMGKPDGPITFNGKVVNPGDPAYPEAAAALIKAQGDARDRSRTKPSSGPISAGAPNVDRSTFEDVKSEDDEILERIRSAFRF
jgi:hypothetical protein